MGKCNDRVRSLSTFSCSFTASLRSTNSQKPIKNYCKHTNCLLSWSRLRFADNAIIVTHLLPCSIHTRERLRAYVCVKRAFCTGMQCPGPHELLPRYSHVFLKLPVSGTVLSKSNTYMYLPFFCFFLSLGGSFNALIISDAALGTTSIFACLFCTVSFTVTFRPFQSCVALAISSPTFLGD